jgi:hypothetical protein
MHRGYLAFISGLTAFGALAAAPPVSVGTLQTFKDWTVGSLRGLQGLQTRWRSNCPDLPQKPNGIALSSTAELCNPAQWPLARKR